MDRRRFLTSATLLAGLKAEQPALAQTEPLTDTEHLGALPPLPADLAANAGEASAPYVDTGLVGTAKPREDEIKKAYEILLDAPYGVKPVDVAQYFLAVGAGSFGQDYRPFTREWPIRANPMIFHFFSATSTKPEGDTTPWCAAFMNWCLLRARAASSDEIGRSPGGFSQNGKIFPDESLKNYSTNHASSGSFRCWDQTELPKRGDIAVFKDAGTDRLTSVCRGTGHVTFFLSNPGLGSIRVLGGNQSSPGSNGAITVSNMSVKLGGRFMKYVSIK